MDFAWLEKIKLVNALIIGPCLGALLIAPVGIGYLYYPDLRNEDVFEVFVICDSIAIAGYILFTVCALFALVIPLTVFAHKPPKMSRVIPGASLLSSVAVGLIEAYVIEKWASGTTRALSIELRYMTLLLGITIGVICILLTVIAFFAQKKAKRS